MSVFKDEAYLTGTLAPVGRTHQFAFDIHDLVTITEISRPARVVGLLVNQEGKSEYRVVYWLDGKRETEWVFADEIVHQLKQTG